MKNRHDKKPRIPTDGEPSSWKNPFAVLKDPNPPASPAPPTLHPDAAPSISKKNRGRVDILRQTAHRGGKTVTVVTGFTGVDDAEITRIARKMQKACGAGGTVKEGRIEIQGDQRDLVARILTQDGFRPVFAGG